MHNAGPVDILATLIEEWREDILAFAHDALNITPTKQQEVVLREFVREGSFTSVRSGHGTGKTATMVICGLWHTALFSPSKTIVTAPSFPQLRDGFIPEMALILDGANPIFRDSLHLTTDRLVVKGREELQFLSARTARPGNESSIQGARADYTAYLIDEAYGVSDKIFETIQGASSKGGTDYGGRKSVYRLLLGGNPTRASGFVYDTHNKNSDKWRSIRLNSEESPLVGKDFLERMSKYKGTDIYRVRVLGEHPLVSSMTLIPRNLLEAAAQRKLDRHSYTFAATTLGVDTAWMGCDRSVITLRQGLYGKILFVGYQMNPVDLAGKVNELWTEYKADACFIDAGGPAAGGVVGALQKWGRSPTKVDFGGSSSLPECYMKRMEMAFKFKQWVEDGAQIDGSPDLVEDFISEAGDIEYGFNSKAQMVLESKDSMRERMRSPDIFDAFITNFAYEVHSKPLKQQLAQMTGRNTDLMDTTYNPFG